MEYSVIGFKCARLVKQSAPKKANIIAGIPNLRTTSRIACFPRRNNLKILFRKWTIAVNAIATSTGKKILNTGTSIVPSPNPENSVSPDARKATKPINIYFIRNNLVNHG